MKEIKLKDKDPMHMESNVQQQKKHRFLGTKMLHNGQKLWEIDLASGEIRPTQMEDTAVVVDGAKVDAKNITKRRKVVIKPLHLYVDAINAKNAARKLAKQVILNSRTNSEIGSACRALLLQWAKSKQGDHETKV